MGLNAIQTYVPWNWHSEAPGNLRKTNETFLPLAYTPPVPKTVAGHYDFSSRGRDLPEFLRAAVCTPHVSSSTFLVITSNSPVSIARSWFARVASPGSLHLR